MSAKQVEGTYEIEPGILDDPKRLEHVIDLGFSTIIDLGQKTGELAGHIERLSKKYAIEEYVAVILNGISDGSGNATIEMEGPNAGMHWLIDRITVVGGIGAKYDLYIQSIQPFNLAERTDDAAENISDLSAPIYVPPEQKVIHVFSTAPANSDVAVRVQYRRIRRAR